MSTDVASPKSSRIILWDVMDTLVHDPFRDVMPAFFGMTLEELLAAKHPSAWATFERGEVTEASFLASFFADGRAYDFAGFKSSVRQAYRWIDGMQNLLAELKDRGQAMHVLSNYPEWYRWIEERLELSRYVSWSFVSCRIGVRKPSAEAFRMAARTLGREPRDCVFVDDRRANCETARSLGMHAIEFQGNVGLLRKELTALGFL